jgi:hypothetical protein
LNHIYVVDSNSQSLALKRVYCEREDEELQLLLENNLALLPGDQFGDDEELRWLLIKREMPVPSPASAENHWSIDFLLVDQFGVPTFVECKRYNDTRARREVIGQVLEYAANGRHYWNADELHSFARQYAGSEETLQERLKALVGTPVAPGEFFASVERNLREYRMRLIFFLEHSSFELRSIVEFLNGQMKDTEVFIVEACQYKSADLRIVAPRVFGYTEEARMAKRESKAATVRNSVVPGEDAFWSTLRQQMDSEEPIARIRALIDAVAETTGCQVRFQKTCIFSIPKILPGRNLMAIWRNGNLELHLPSWNARGSEVLTPAQAAAREMFFNEIAAICGVDPSQLATKSWPQFKPEIWLPRIQEVQSLIGRVAAMGEDNDTSSEPTDMGTSAI